MDAIGPVIRLENDSYLGQINPFKLSEDWLVDEHNRLVYHEPSKLAFVIDYTPPAEGEWVKPSDLSARVVHTCGNGDVPAEAKLVRLAKDAIWAFVVMAEVCQKPIDPNLPLNEDEIPF